MDLVVDQVRQLEHVDVADAHLLLERLTCHTVEECGLAGGRQVTLRQERLQVDLLATIKDGGRELDPQRLTSPSKVGLENLPDVHATRHAQRVEHDLDGCPVRQVRHVFFGQDARDHTLVPVTARHLVANLKLALHGHIDLDQLDHARGQLVALLQKLNTLLVDPVNDLDMRVRLAVDLLDPVDDLAIPRLNPQEVVARKRLQHVVGNRVAAFEQDITITPMYGCDDLLA